MGWMISGPARAAIIGEATFNSDGSYTYSYQIDPQGRIVTNWELAFGLPQPDWVLPGVAVPNGWVVDWAAATGKPNMDFIETLGMGAGPDQILTGFSFSSLFGPGLVDFTEFGTDANGDFGSQGSVIGPAFAANSVPESLPGWVAWASCGLLLALHVRSQVRRPRVRPRGFEKGAETFVSDEALQDAAG
jgi:hypothetical protein